MDDSLEYDVCCPECGCEFVYRAKAVKEVVEPAVAFGEKKVWDSYLVLNHYAKIREYGVIGLTKCVSYLVGHVNVSDTVARRILRKMANEPYCFIVVKGGQVFVKKKEVVENIIADIPKISEVK